MASSRDNMDSTLAVKWFCAVTLTALLVTGCKPSGMAPVQPNNAEAARTNYYFVKGVLRSGIRPDGRSVVIEHEEIPNYMPKMTMPFYLKDTNDVAPFAVGDILHFRIVDTPDAAWIDQITKVGVATNNPATNRTFRLVREVDPLVPGDVMPNYSFTNELGKSITLADYKGQAYGLTFIFTRCQYPEFCPKMSGNFAKVAQAMTADPNAPTNWHLFTITFDVEYDTPKVLQSYSKQWRADPARWSFLTGALIDIDAITEQFGLVFPKSDTGFGFDHTMRSAIVDAQGKVFTNFIGNEWKPEEFAAALKEAAKRR
jgi:protein SCO1/2